MGPDSLHPGPPAKHPGRFIKYLTRHIGLRRQRRHPSVHRYVTQGYRCQQSAGETVRPVMFPRLARVLWVPYLLLPWSIYLWGVSSRLSHFPMHAVGLVRRRPGIPTRPIFYNFWAMCPFATEESSPSGIFRTLPNFGQKARDLSGGNFLPRQKKTPSTPPPPSLLPQGGVHRRQTHFL